MKSLFESLFTTKEIIRAKYPNGWVGWLNDGMSDEDDGQLTRFTTMDGGHMYQIVEGLKGYGFKPPELKNGCFYCNDYFLSVYEYYQYIEEDISKYSCKPPEWLNLRIQPEMSLFEIYKKGLDYLDYNGLDYSVRI